MAVAAGRFEVVHPTAGGLRDSRSSRAAGCSLYFVTVEAKLIMAKRSPSLSWRKAET